MRIRDGDSESEKLNKQGLLLGKVARLEAAKNAPSKAKELAALKEKYAKEDADRAAFELGADFDD